MDEHVIYLLDIGAKIFAKHDYPPTPFEFAAALGIRMIPGDEDSANAGPPAIITYGTQHVSKRRFPLWHEIAHVISAWYGIEKDLEDALGPDQAGPRIEDIADLVAGLFAISAPLVTLAMQRHGVSGAAIEFLAQKANVNEAVAMRRLIHHDLTASRAGALLSGSHVIDLASQNYLLPLTRGHRVSEMHMSFPKADLHLLYKSRLLAVWDD